jgi:predicted secreted protein
MPVDLDTKILNQIGDGEYIADASEDSAGGVTKFIFQAVSPGETHLNLGFAMISEVGEDFVSQKSFGMTVIVSGESPNVFVVTPDATGPQTVNLEVGDVLVIELPTIPENYYEWIAQDLDTTILRQVGMAEFVPDIDQDSIGGVTRLKFEAVGVGEINIILVFASKAEPTIEFVAKDTFGLTVIVE